MKSVIDAHQLKEIVSLLNQCTDVYIFIYDLTEDTYTISEEALKLFDLPGSSFTNATASIIKIVYPADRKILSDDLDELRSGRKIEHNLEYRWIDRNGKIVWISCKGRMTLGKDGRESVMIGRVDRIDRGSKVDHLTGLFTGTQLRTDFEKNRKSYRHISGYIFKIDIDNLGILNDRFGREKGDQVVALVADCCKKICGDSVRLYRSGGDEITCLNMGGDSADEARKCYLSIKRMLAESAQQLDYEIVFTVSAGIVGFYGDFPEFEDLLKKLDFSVNRAKKNGKNTYALFDAIAYSSYLHHMDVEERLRLSVKENFKGFELYFQPVIDARELFVSCDHSSPSVIGAEALLRWSCPELGELRPSEFIPILEESGLIIPVGRWVLLTAMRQCAVWNKTSKKFFMSINLSYIQIQKSDILSDVQIALEKTAVDPYNIVLELTESGYLDNDSQMQRILAAFDEMHIKIDIDDFGTGYSNLRYLQNLHAHTLKLDYSFIQKATAGNECDSKVIKYITEMAHDLNMAVCMEGVESADDVAKLKKYKPDTFQGYHFGHPVNAQLFEEQNLLPRQM
jgi:diguanylate cyclase (GGDEF)-like protein